MFEEIRRLRLERGRLLQKIKALEQQQQSALSALEEVLPTHSHSRVCKKIPIYWIYVCAPVTKTSMHL